MLIKDFFRRLREAKDFRIWLARIYMCVCVSVNRIGRGGFLILRSKVDR